MDSKFCLVSIIIPTYNSEDYLNQALKSIVNQTFKDIEVLIMDGLSSDKTVEIAEKFKQDLPQIQIYSDKDNGIYDAMNKGIKKAKGEWIYFMGSDDTFYENKTLQNFKDLEKLELDILYGNVYSNNFNGLYDGEFSLTKLIKKNVCHQAMFYRKKVFEKKGNFNLKYKVYADWDFNIRCFFSKKINTKYHNFTVANFADGGYSSLNNDQRFNRIRPYKCLYLGFDKLPKKEIKKLLKEIYYFKVINKFLRKVKRKLIL